MSNYDSDPSDIAAEAPIKPCRGSILLPLSDFGVELYNPISHQIAFRQIRGFAARMSLNLDSLRLETPIDF